MLGFVKRLVQYASGDFGIPNSLNGTFDLRGDTLTGWVEKIPYATNDGVVVEVTRLGTVIAECATGRETAGGRLPFTLPLAGRFSVSDLAHETVIVGARSRRGDTGTLKLDGATQLELVRSYLGVPTETILDLDFCRLGAAGPYLGSGWSGAEDVFTWTIDDNSLIYLPSPAAQGTYRLRMRFGIFLPPTLPAQKMEVFVNEQQVDAFTTDTREVDFRESRIDAAPFTLAATTTLRLYHPYAGRPSDHTGGKDTRRLAFSFRRLTIVRVLDAEL